MKANHRTTMPCHVVGVACICVWRSYQLVVVIVKYTSEA